jgi:hypothetical protein
MKTTMPVASTYKTLLHIMAQLIMSYGMEQLIMSDSMA